MQNKAQVGGVLNIISGVFGVIGALALLAMIVFFGYIFSLPEVSADLTDTAPLAIIQVFYGIAAFVLLVLGIIGIVGGVYAMKKRAWGLALAGAICGILTFLPLGIIATIFIAQAQKEFSTSASPVVAETTEAHLP